MPAVNSHHGVLAANTVDTVTLITDLCVDVLVSNRGVTDIYVTLTGTAPVVGADNTYIVIANTSKEFTAPNPIQTVKLISTGTPAYSVEAINR